MTIPHVLLTNLTVIASVMFLLWCVNVRRRHASIVDISWGLGFVLVAWLTYQISGADSSLRN